MLYRAVYALTIRILPGILGHTVAYLMPAQILFVNITGVLNTTVSVNYKTFKTLFLIGFNSLFKTSDLTFSTQIPAAMAGYNPTGVHINHKTDVIPTVARPNIGNIGLPNLIGAFYAHPLNQVPADVGTGYRK